MFAFPGSHDGFFSQQEINEYNLTIFPQWIIWGVNASCVSPTNGSIYPADVQGFAYYMCANYSFYQNMEQSLQNQAKYLKLMENTSPPAVFGYIEFTNCQESYVAQHQFNQPNNSNWWLKLEKEGVIDCRQDGCNWQGPTWRQYDLRQDAVKDYHVNSVVASLANTTYLDGIFLDSISSWIEDLCPRWQCTQQELNDLANASITTATMAVEYLKKNNKYVSVSSHVDMFYRSDYYWKYRDLLENNNNAIRYWEGLESSFGSSFYNHFVTYMNETAANIPEHVHAASKTLNPDWVELAAYLIGAHNQTWFSFSHGWTITSGWYQPEFIKPLGTPLNDGKCVSDGKWNVFMNTNNVYGQVDAGKNSTDGTIIYVGEFSDYQGCIDGINALDVGNKNFGSFTWADNNAGIYAKMCYAKYGESWNIEADNTSISGHFGNLYCTRQFEHCDVQLDVLNYAANITWH